MEEDMEGISAKNVASPGDSYWPGDTEEEQKVIEALEDHNHPRHICYSACYAWEDPEHDGPLHVCRPECPDWEDPDWPESCGDED